MATTHSLAAINALPSSVWPACDGTIPPLAWSQVKVDPYHQLHDRPRDVADAPPPPRAVRTHSGAPPIPLAQPRDDTKNFLPTQRIPPVPGALQPANSPSPSASPSASSTSHSSVSEQAEVISTASTRPASLKRSRPLDADHSSGRSCPSADGMDEFLTPAVYATMWEDESTFCYQVCRSGHVVSRRVDTDYVNCTKLINMVGLTRGKRDLILKRESTKVIFRQGNLQLKGVWCPLAAAKRLASNHGLLSQLSPLFDDSIEEHLYAPDAIVRTASLVDATRVHHQQVRNDAKKTSKIINEGRYTAMLGFLARMEARVRDVERPSFLPHKIREKAPPRIWEPEPFFEERLILPPEEHGGPREEEPRSPDPSAELAAFTFGTTYRSDDERPLSAHHAYQPVLLPDRPFGFDRRHSYPSTSHQHYNSPAGPPRRYSTLPSYPPYPPHQLEHSITEHQPSTYPYYPSPDLSPPSTAHSSQPHTPAWAPATPKPFSPLYPPKADYNYMPEPYTANFASLWAHEPYAQQQQQQQQQAAAPAFEFRAVEPEWERRSAVSERRDSIGAVFDAPALEERWAHNGETQRWEQPSRVVRFDGYGEERRWSVDEGRRVESGLDAAGRRQSVYF